MHFREWTCIHVFFFFTLLMSYIFLSILQDDHHTWQWDQAGSRTESTEGTAPSLSVHQHTGEQGDCPTCAQYGRGKAQTDGMQPPNLKLRSCLPRLAHSFPAGWPGLVLSYYITPRLWIYHNEAHLLMQLCQNVGAMCAQNLSYMICITFIMQFRHFISLVWQGTWLIWNWRGLWCNMVLQNVVTIVINEANK